MTLDLDDYDEHPEAVDELLGRVRYYGPVKGAEFNQSALVAIESVVNDPQSWPPVAYWDGIPVVRSRKIRGFVERVVYYVRANGRPVIIAYAHHKQPAGYWAHRFSD
ncbi:hypothetical protein [Microbacterium sp.]|uniref:hypothetical protein n=1 Tax=Microbacterium sp. TaxID=51671 RepID=UPI003C78511B